jgi:hypothetical protein
VRTVDRGAPVGPPPEPGPTPDLATLTDRLARLREWSGLSLRDIAELVERLRLARRTPDEPGRRPSYGAVHALFQHDRKRLNEGLFLDVVRVLLDRQSPHPSWREEQTTLWRNAYRTAMGGRPVSDGPHRDFSIGPLRTPCRILEGDGEHAIPEENVRVVVNPVNVKLPAEVAQWRDVIVDRQLRLRHEGREHVWNGPRYAVEDFFATRVGPVESPEVTLRLKHSDYYTFLAAQRLDDQLSDGGTLRSEYLDGRDPREVPEFMRSSFGLNVAVVTADDWLVVSRRSSRLGIGQGQWNSSANEGLHRNLDGPGGVAPNLFRAAERGVREELRLDPDQYDLRLLAFVVVTRLSQWAALFLARLHTTTRAGFEANAGRGIADGWEHPEFDFVRFTPADVVDYLLRDDRRDYWAPAAPVLFYLSLVNAFGRRAVDAEVERR